MRQSLLALLAATALTAAVPAVASAQSINDRQAKLDARIDAGVRSGDLTASEAARLRAEFSDLSRLEARYRSGGLSASERADLDRRFDALSRQIRDERHDRQERGGRDDRGGGNINDRQAKLDARIDAGVRSGDLTASEAARLRAEFADLARLEARYRSGGLSASERADLDRRFDALSRQIRDERHDRQERGDRGDRGDGGNGAINQRERDIATRIDAGVRNGSLTRNEAYQLRTELEAIERIEDQYRNRGLSQAERQYIDRRIDLLERRLRTDRRDDDRRWTQLDARQAQFEQRLTEAVRDRRLSEREAYNLRMEFRGIARLERQYRNSRPGITQAERIDLNRRFDRMEANLRAASSPTDNLFETLFGLLGQQ